MTAAYDQAYGEAVKDMTVKVMELARLTSILGAMFDSHVEGRAKESGADYYVIKLHKDQMADLNWLVAVVDHRARAIDDLMTDANNAACEAERR